MTTLPVGSAPFVRRSASVVDQAPPIPCPSCPWRTDARADDIPNFSLPQAKRLRATCPDARGFGQGFDASWFACHQSRDGAEIPCAGWLAQVGNAYPLVRLAVSQGCLPAETLSPGTNWPPLHDNYGQVMERLYETHGSSDGGCCAHATGDKETDGSC